MYTNVLNAANGKPTPGIDGFDSAQAAAEFTPLPPGIYNARIVRGEYTSTKNGADAYRIRFEVIEGPHTGKTLLRTWTFGTKALPYTKRDLAPFGLVTKAQLLSPFPPAGKEYFVQLLVVLQRRDDGIERNDVKKIDVLRVVDSPAAAFMLPERSEGGPK